MNWTKGDYLVSDDKDRLQTSEIEVLMKQGEWSSKYSPERIERLRIMSFWLGLYLKGQLIGLARMVTDQETVTMITDVIIHEAHQRKGLGSWLLDCLVKHPCLKETSMSLGTQDADRFFERLGFERSGSLMHRFPPPVRSPGITGAPPGFGPKRKIS